MSLGFKRLNCLDPGNVHLNNLNAPVLNVLIMISTGGPSCCIDLNVMSVVARLLDLGQLCSVPLKATPTSPRLFCAS